MTLAGDATSSVARDAATTKRREDLGKHTVYTHFPKDRKLRDLPEDQNYKSPVQNTHWRSRTSCRKCWWFDHSRRQSSQWRLWISKLSPICSRGAGPRHPIVSVQTRTSQETQRSLQKFLGPNRKPKVMYTDNVWEFGRACEELSRNHCTSTTTKIRNKWDCRKSSAQSERRDICSIVAIRSGQRMVGGIHGVLLLLRNNQDLLSDGKTPFERRFGEPVNGPVIPFGAMVEYHPISAKDRSGVHQFGPKVLPGKFLGYE